MYAIYSSVYFLPGIWILCCTHQKSYGQPGENIDSLVVQSYKTGIALFDVLVDPVATVAGVVWLSHEHPNHHHGHRIQ
jgi:hypothetical protein